MGTEKTFAIKTKYRFAEAIRKHLLKHHILRTDLKIKKNATDVFLPICDRELIKKIEIGQPFDIVTQEFLQLHEKITDYRILLSIPKIVEDKLPISYDVIGNILIIRLDEEIIPYQKEIGNALMKTHKHIQSVYQSQAIQGELRTRDVSYIAGINQTETVHKEFGLTFSVDIKNTYFSPRLATERRYISTLVKPHEIILDMFTGIAPFPLVIAKFAKPKKIFAIDKNRIAIDYAMKNIIHNKQEELISLYCDDAKNAPIIMKKQEVLADRIIMNLPFSSMNYFSYALQCLKKDGIIHLYMICHEEQIEQHVQSLHNIAKIQQLKLIIQQVRKIKTYAPHEFYIGIDITSEKSPHMPT